MKYSLFSLLLLIQLSGTRDPVYVKPLALANYEDIYKGSVAPLIVNFWATWCAPCVREIPDLQGFAEEHGLDITFVSLDDPGDTERVTKVLTARGVRGTHYLLSVKDEELGSILPEWYGAVPLTIFYDKGKRTHVFDRQITEKDLAQIHNYLQK